MRLSADETALLRVACNDLSNQRAQELVNVLGTALADEILSLMQTLPPEFRRDLENHVREAIEEQKRRIRPR